MYLEFPQKTFNMIIKRLKKYNQENIFNEEKMKYYSESEYLTTFCTIYKIDIDTFNSKAQLYIMILFYLYLSKIYGVFNNLYYYLCDIQTCFYSKIRKGNSYHVKLKNKDDLLKMINKIIYIILQKQKHEKRSSGSLYDISIKEFHEFLNKNGIDKKKFSKLETNNALLTIILFYGNILTLNHTWYLIDIRNSNVIDFLYMQNPNEFEYKSSFFEVKYPNFIADINEKINLNNIYKDNNSEENNEYIFRKKIRNIVNNIYTYSKKTINHKKLISNKYYFPDCKEFSDYFNHASYTIATALHSISFFDVKTQLYLIILFYLNWSSILQKPRVYIYIVDIQKILFYKLIRKGNKCFGILNEKQILLNSIKNIINGLITSKNDEKDDTPINIYNSIKIKEFDEF